MTMQTEHHDPHTTLAALADQIDCYRRVAELAAEQSRHVRNGDTERLLIVLEQRQGQMDSITELEQSLAPVKRAWPASAESWSEAQREEAQGLLAESKRLLEQITTRDAEDMVALQGRRQEVGRQLQKMDSDGRAVRQINRRYATAAYAGTGGRMDLKR